MQITHNKKSYFAHIILKKIKEEKDVNFISFWLAGFLDPLTRLPMFWVAGLLSLDSLVFLRFGR